VIYGRQHGSAIVSWRRVGGLLGGFLALAAFFSRLDG